MSCALNTLLAREGYDQPKELWDGRSTHAMRLLDAAAQAGSLNYQYLNTVAAGLVARPEHMPGRVLDFGHWKTGGIVVKRPDVFFSKNRPSELWLELTPPPLLMHAFGGDLDALVHHMRRLAEEGIRALGEARTRPPLGAARVCDLHPWMEPKTLVETGGRPVPTFKVGARGLVARHVECSAAVEVTGWRRWHEGSRLERLAGNADAVFPHGTYGMRLFHNVPVAAPDPMAIVSAPGPLLHEVMADLGEVDPSERRRVIDEVREAWRSEAAEVAEHEDLDFRHAERPSKPRAAGAPADAASETSGSSEEEEPKPERPEPKVRHRFDRDAERVGPHPRRLIITRDRRKRRKRHTRRRSSDPPS